MVLFHSIYLHSMTRQKREKRGGDNCKVVHVGLIGNPFEIVTKIKCDYLARTGKVLSWERAILRAIEGGGKP